MSWLSKRDKPDPKQVFAADYAVALDGSLLCARFVVRVKAV